MSENQATLEAYRLVHNGSLALAEVSTNGMFVDVPYLDRTQQDIDAKIKAIKEELRGTDLFGLWRKRYGQKATLTSPQQLAGVFFDVLGYESTDKTAKDKKPKADEKSLRKLKWKDKSHAKFVDRYYEMKGLDKLSGTYLKGIAKEIVDGLIHASYNLHIVSTFRSSSSNPNSQNYIKEAVFRRCFVPRNDDFHFVELDYGSHEFRICAAVWGDPEMIRYASDPSLDIHRDMAALIFKLEKSQVTKELRALAKSYFVFATLYGSWWMKTAGNLWDNCRRLKLADGTQVRKHLRSKGIKELGGDDVKVDQPEGSFRKHLKEIEAEFFRKFSVFAKVKDEWYNNYRRNLGFPTKTGFWISRMGEKDDQSGGSTGGLCTKNFCLNAPIQSVAFHCLLWSLIRLQKLLKKRGLRSIIIGQVHDSLLLEIHKDEVQEVLTLARRVMTKDIRKAWDWIVVPLEIEAAVAPLKVKREDGTESRGSWWDKKPWVERDGVWGPKEKVA